MTNLTGEIGTFHMHDLLYQIFSATSAKLLPIFQRRLLTTIPPELQQDWLTIVGELVSSLTVPLPLPSSWGPAFTLRYTPQGEVLLSRNGTDSVDPPGVLALSGGGIPLQTLSGTPITQPSAGSSSGTLSHPFYHTVQHNLSPLPPNHPSLPTTLSARRSRRL